MIPWAALEKNNFVCVGSDSIPFRGGCVAFVAVLCAARVHAGHTRASKFSIKVKKKMIYIAAKARAGGGGVLSCLIDPGRGELRR